MKNKDIIIGLRKEPELLKGKKTKFVTTAIFKKKKKKTALEVFMVKCLFL